MQKNPFHIKVVFVEQTARDRQIDKERKRIEREREMGNGATKLAAIQHLLKKIPLQRLLRTLLAARFLAHHLKGNEQVWGQQMHTIVHQ